MNSHDVLDSDGYLSVFVYSCHSSLCVLKGDVETKHPSIFLSVSSPFSFFVFYFSQCFGFHLGYLALHLLHETFRGEYLLEVVNGS